MTYGLIGTVVPSASRIPPTIEVRANAKLRARLAGIVAEIAGCSAGEAEGALAACGGNGRAAVLQVALGLSPAAAVERAAAHASLRAALER